MTNISNIFYWNLKSNEKIALSKLNDIKTSDLIRCKIKNDRIYIAPFDETDSKFNENDAWKIIDKISEKYKTIEEFVIKYKSDKKWIWQNFYKKNNSDIEIAIKEEDMGVDFNKSNDNEKNDDQDVDPNKTNDIEKTNGQGVGGYISAETSTISNGEDLENFETIINNLKFDDTNEKYEDDYIPAETSKFEKIDEKILTFFITQLPKKINDESKIKKIKEEISKAKSIEDLQNIILSTFEDMGDISKDDINNLLNLDSNSKLESGQVSYSKGMGAFFKIQSIVNDGSLKDTNSMYDHIWDNLERIYNNNKENCSSSEQKELEKNYNFLKEEENPIKASDLAKLSVIYARFLKNWKEGDGNQDAPNSKYFRNNMTSYFPEVLTPFTILWGEKEGNSQCIDKKGKEAIEKLKKKVGDGFEYSSISFPQSDYQPLFDSVLYFKSPDDSYKCIRLSTKGGKNGLGAQASILGLLTYFYKKGKLPQDIFTKKFWSLDASNYENAYQDYMYAFALKPENEFALKILSAFMLASSNQYHTIVNNIFEIIRQDEKYNKEFEKQLDFYNNITDKRRKKPTMIETLKARVKGLIVQKYINDHKEFQDCVLAALKYASFDFAQVNYKETGNDGDDFHYEIFVQYPAIFDGEIRFELMQGLKFHKLKFHILGSNIEH